MTVRLSQMHLYLSMVKSQKKLVFDEKYQVNFFYRNQLIWQSLALFLFQTLNNISAEKNSTIIFPLPIDLVTHFMKEKKAWSA